MTKRKPIVALRLSMIPLAALSLAACQPVTDANGRRPDGLLSKAEIDSCLAGQHIVGNDVVSPKPQPHHVFKPGYNFSVKSKDGSYGYGYEEASDGHLLVKYPEHGTSFDYGVARKSGVVYFGDKPTNCT